MQCHLSCSEGKWTQACWVVALYCCYCLYTMSQKTGPQTYGGLVATNVVKFWPIFTFLSPLKRLLSCQYYNHVIFPTTKHLKNVWTKMWPRKFSISSKLCTAKCDVCSGHWLARFVVENIPTSVACDYLCMFVTVCVGWVLVSPSPSRLDIMRACFAFFLPLTLVSFCTAARTNVRS